LPLEAEVLVKTYKENNDVKYSILEDKIFEFLTTNANIKEIEIDLSKKNTEEEIIS